MDLSLSAFCLPQSVLRELHVQTPDMLHQALALHSARMHAHTHIRTHSSKSRPTDKLHFIPKTLVRFTPLSPSRSQSAILTSQCGYSTVPALSSNGGLVELKKLSPNYPRWQQEECAAVTWCMLMGGFLPLSRRSLEKHSVVTDPCIERHRQTSTVNNTAWAFVTKKERFVWRK